jgi:hypothetical protein
LRRIGYRKRAAVSAKNPATILDRYDRPTVTPSIFPAPWAKEPIPGTMKPIMMSGIAKLKNALKIVENDTKICTTTSVGMEIFAAELMPLISPGVSEPMSTPPRMAITIHARSGIF